jgi:hypothetical protein
MQQTLCISYLKYLVKYVSIIFEDHRFKCWALLIVRCASVLERVRKQS